MIKILDRINPKENVLFTSSREDNYILTDRRFILKKDPLAPDYIQISGDKIRQCGKIYEDYMLLNLEYLEEIILQTYNKNKEIVWYFEFKKKIPIEQMKTSKKRFRKKKNIINVELAVGLESFEEQNQLLLEIIRLKPDIKILAPSF